MRHLILIFTLILIISSPAFADSFEEGKAAYQKRDWFNAIRILRPLAEQGDDRALVILGNMYNDGNGVKQDHMEALNHYKRAILKDNATAMTSIATMYAQGIGVERDFKKGYDFFVKAANLGNPAAQIMVASIYIEGHPELPDVKADPTRAYAMYRVVELNSDEPRFVRMASELSKRLISMLDAEQVLEAEQMAKAWAPKTSITSDTPTTEGQE